MNAIVVQFRDENGQERSGELINPFTLTGGGEFVNVEYPGPMRLDVLTFGIHGEMQAHSLEMSAVRRMFPEAVAV